MNTKKYLQFRARYKCRFFYILTRVPCFRCAACRSGYRFSCLHPVVLRLRVRRISFVHRDDLPFRLRQRVALYSITETRSP